MKQRLLNHINSITDPLLRGACETIFNHDKFFVCPAAIGFHHAYEGGLLVHTVEVCDIALGMSVLTTNQNLAKPWCGHDILIAAALFHDLIKIKEYDSFWDFPANTVGQRLLRIPGTDESGLQKFWKHTDYGKSIGHICGSAAAFQTAADYRGVSFATIEAVTHCILAHHGRKEWGSPVEPQTLEALILHQADMLSAKFGATKDIAPQ